MEPGVQTNVWSRIRVRVRRYLGAIRRIWWLLPLTISVGTCIAAWFVSRMPPAYESQGRMIYTGQYQLSTPGAVYEDQITNYFGTQIELMHSKPVQDDALARVLALHPELKPEEVEFKVVQSAQASMLELNVTAPDPVFAQAYLDAIMESYLDEKKKEREERSVNTTAGLSEMMDHLQAAIDKNDNDMLEFQKANNIGFLEQEGNTAAKYLDELNHQLADLQSNAHLLSMLDLDQTLDRQQSQAETGSAGDNKIETSLTGVGGPIADYQKARQQIALLNEELSDMSQRLKPKHPDIIALNLEIKRQENLIATLRVQSEEALKTHQQDLALQIQNLQDQIKVQEQKALQLSSILAKYNQLKAKSDRAKADYDSLLTSTQSVNVGKTVEQDPLTILEPASKAESVKPGLVKIFFAGIGGGLIIGLLVLFVVDQTDDRIASLMELQTHFPERLLGQIPQEKIEDRGALLQPADERQALLESFRTLRSSILFLPVEGKRPKTILVTSALPDEGKTTVASNLSVTLAFSGARTLIVDADMRRGQVSRVFGAIECNGLSDVLLQKKPWKECVYTTSTENLFLLPCGPSLQHTSEHLLGKVTDDFLVSIYDQFDYVILDSPPVIILDDTLCLAPKVDATIFVVRFNSSSVRSSRRALELLDNRQVNVIGVVCNGVTMAETQYNYNYNYTKYGSKYAEVRSGS